MSNSKKRKLILITLVASLAISYVLGQMKPTPDKNITERKSPIVSSITLKKENIKISIDSQGMVAPLIETILSAEVSGTIVEISPKFLAGGVFKEGEILMRIDPTIYIVALDQAKALKDQRQNEYEDAEKIRKQGFLSESEYLSSVTALAAAEAELVKSQRNLDRTKIVLPYDGMVRDKSADLGQYVNIGKQLGTKIVLPYDGMVRDKSADLGQYVNIGKQLGTVFATDVAEVRLPLSDKDVLFADLPSSQQTSLSDDVTGPEVEFTDDQSNSTNKRYGYIARSEGVIDEKTRMTYAVARLEDPYNLKGKDGITALPIGSFVSAKIYPTKEYEFIKIPRSAIINNRQVILINDSNQIYFQNIELVRTDKDFGYIAEGIEDGQRISITSIEDGINGMKVRIDQ